MKPKIFLILTLLLTVVVLNPFNAVAMDDNSVNNAELSMKLFGSSLFLGPRSIGFVLVNKGDTTLHDISWSFSVTTDSGNTQPLSFSDEIDELEPGLVVVFSTHYQVDRGFVNLKGNANCSQISDISDSIDVYQIGSFFIGRPFALAYILAA